MKRITICFLILLLNSLLFAYDYKGYYVVPDDDISETVEKLQNDNWKITDLSDFVVTAINPTKKFFDIFNVTDLTVGYNLDGSLLLEVISCENDNRDLSLYYSMIMLFLKSTKGTIIKQNTSYLDSKLKLETIINLDKCLIDIILTQKNDADYSMIWSTTYK